MHPAQARQEQAGRPGYGLRPHTEKDGRTPSSRQIEIAEHQGQRRDGKMRMGNTQAFIETPPARTARFLAEITREI
jgi:hypothetical protein